MRWLSIFYAPILDVLIQSEIRLCFQATQNYFAYVYAVFHNFKIAFLLEKTGRKAKHLELAGRVIQIQTENFNIKDETAVAQILVHSHLDPGI